MSQNYFYNNLIEQNKVINKASEIENNKLFPTGKKKYRNR